MYIAYIRRIRVDKIRRTELKTLTNAVHMYGHTYLPNCPVGPSELIRCSMLLLLSVWFALKNSNWKSCFKVAVIFVYELKVPTYAVAVSSLRPYMSVGSTAERSMAPKKNK